MKSVCMCWCHLVSFPSLVCCNNIFVHAVRNASQTKNGNFYHVGGSNNDGGDLVEPLVEVLRYHLKADVFNGCAWRKPKG